MKVTFRIHYNTMWGDNLYVCGSSVKLGNWAPNKAYPMVHQGAGEWEASIEFEQEEQFEYKFLVKPGKQNAIWEGGNNRLFKGVSGWTFEIRDFWKNPSDPEIVMQTNLFTKVLMKPLAPKEKTTEIKSHKIVRFSVNMPRVMPGHSVAIVGNQQPLGNWAHPVKLNSNDFPIWSTDFDLTKLTFPIVYKYVVTNEQGQIIHWEDGNERQIFYVNPNIKNLVHLQNDEKFRHSLKPWKGAGVAVPVFSLRSEESFGCGEFNDLKKLADWASLTGLKVIQVLPINETIATHSWLDSYPYKAISVIALHPMYLNIKQLGILEDERLMDEFDILREVLNSKTYVDYIEVTRLKSKYYKLIFDQEWKKLKNTEEYNAFFEENQDWLETYAAFCFLRDKYKTSNFRNWGIWANYDKAKIAVLVNQKSKHHEHIAVHYFIQFHLDKQLKEAVEYAHQKGIALKGDIPIGISPNSIEAWTNPDLFNLNGQAGAPPDDFAVLGQNWGFPTYNWDAMAKDGFTWWRKRLSVMEKYFDAYRIDHILGFFRIWEIPRNAMHGLLGYFKPGLPLTVQEIEEQGIWFDHHRFLMPYIKKHMLHNLFGQHTDEVLSLYLRETENGTYKIVDELKTQQEIYNHFTPDEQGEQEITEKNVVIRDGLISLLDEVIFIQDPYSTVPAFHPRIAMHQSASYMELNHHQKAVLNAIYIDFYYHRHDEFWKNEAYHKLPAIMQASNMLVCGEDLGMVPDCVPEVMRALNILSLEIQRMPKNPNIEFGHPSDLPYLAVCTTSTHDMSTIRGWWEENREKTERFYHRILGHNNPVPYFAEPWVCKEIIMQHIYSPAMLAIFPIQDLIAMDGQLRWDKTEKERINVPSDAKNKWRYRMILHLEELLKSYNFNNMLSEMIGRSGRNMAE